MSGLEVAALVAAIVSAFVGTASFLQERKKRKAEKAARKRSEMDKLQLAVMSAPYQIRQEYEYDIVRIGGRFASGDGKYLALLAFCSIVH
jgi:cation transport ATPase